MRKWDRELRRIPGVKGVEQTNGAHLRLLLTNGRFVRPARPRATSASFITSIVKSGANCVGLAINIPLGALSDRRTTN